MPEPAPGGDDVRETSRCFPQLRGTAAAGVALADRNGLGAVSMRAVAAAMGTNASALYRYLTSRDELLDLMVDHVLAGPVIAHDGRAWDDQVIALATAQLAVHRHHPWLADAVATPRVFGPNGLDWADSFLGALATIDQPSSVKMELSALVTGVVTLFSRRERSNGSRSITPTQMLDAIDADRHRNLVAVLGDSPPDEVSEDLFERTIRALAHGLLDDG